MWTLYDQIHPRRREAPPRAVFAHLWSIFDHFGIVFRRNFDKFRTAIVKLRTNFVPIIANIMTEKVPIISLLFAAFAAS